MKLTSEGFTKTVTLKRLADHKLGLFLDEFKEPVAEIVFGYGYNMDKRDKYGNPDKVGITVLKMESASGIGLQIEHGHKLTVTLDRG